MDEQPQLPPRAIPPQEPPMEIPPQAPQAAQPYPPELTPPQAQQFPDQLFPPNLPPEFPPPQYQPSEVDARIAEDQRLAAGVMPLGMDNTEPLPPPGLESLVNSRARSLGITLLIALPILFVSGISVAAVVSHNHKQAELAKLQAAQQLAQSEDQSSDTEEANKAVDPTDDSSTDNTSDATKNTSSNTTITTTPTTTPAVKPHVITTKPTPTPTPTPNPTPTPAPTPSTKVSKVLVIIEENHSLSQMQSGMPYAFSLAKQYGYATDYITTVTSTGAAVHPSLPNYIALASGSYYNISDDHPPSSHKLTGASAFGQAIKAGKTAKTYAEGMTSNCQQSDTGKYAVKHNPWAYFVNERTTCNQYDVPLTKFAGDVAAGALPNVGMLIPNLDNDAHDSSLATADKFFKTQIQTVFSGPDWKAGRLVVILTADEDDKKTGNKVLTVVMHPSIHAKVVSSHLTHYSVTKLYADVAHTAPLLGGTSAPSLSAAFGLQIQ